MTRPSTAPRDASALAFDLAGSLVVPDLTGALYWPDERTLVVSDLHLEKGSSFARAGTMLPPYDTRTTLRLVAEACARWSPLRVIALGDSFHDIDASGRLDGEDVAVLGRLVSAREWIWILGNHDPEPPVGLGGFIAREVALGPLVFRHEPLGVPVTGEVAGHFHPCARIALRGRTARRRCFVSDGRRLIMPTMGAYAGGLNVLDRAYRPHFQGDFAVWALGRERVYPFARAQLLPDG